MRSSANVHVKQCSAVFVPIIAHLANIAFNSLKECFRLLKKLGLERSDQANYRPISNMNNISKIVERLVLVRLLLSDNFSEFQSVYRADHSTGAALLRFLDSVYSSNDKKQLIVFVGWNISAAFIKFATNTVEMLFSVSGKILEWLSSYHRSMMSSSYLPPSISICTLLIRCYQAAVVKRQHARFQRRRPGFNSGSQR